MPMPPAPMPLSEADYDAIEAAVMETSRGRWFLAEYAKRNRHADTSMLLTAIERIEAAIRGEPSGQSVDRIRMDLVEMARAISRTKMEIATIKPDTEHHGKFGEATEELDSIVHMTELATSDILAAAEQIQEIAWTLREQGLQPEICDLIDTKATDIYTACSFQDLTGQRTSKVVQVLRYLEGRINAMIDIWGVDREIVAEATESARAHSAEESLFRGSTRPGAGLDQADVDVVMGPALAAASAAVSARQDLAVIETDGSIVNFEAMQPEGPDSRRLPSPAPRPQADTFSDRRIEDARADDDELDADDPPRADTVSPAAEPSPPEARPMTRSAETASDPLASITALSMEEKIALFS